MSWAPDERTARATPVRAAWMTALRALVLMLAFWLAALSGAAAQDAPTQAQWEALAARAETTLESDRASDLALEQLRSELVQYREQFLASQGTNQSRINTIQGQIAGLGPEPGADGPPDLPDIAARRIELQEQLARLQAPRRAAEEAYIRADGLIREIDKTIRDRQAAEAMTLGPTPLNPALWRPAASALGQSVGRMTDEIASGLKGGDAAILRENLPAVVFFLSIALALLVRGRYWMEWLTLRIYSVRRSHGSPAIAFMVSLAQVIVPVLGMFALREALYASNVLGLRGQILAEMLPRIGFIFFGAMWLGARVFPRHDQIAAPLALAAAQRREGRTYAAVLGFFLCLRHVLDRLAAFDRYDDATVAVLSFPLLLGVGLILWRYGLIMLRFSEPHPVGGGGEPSEDGGFYLRMVHLSGRVFIGLGLFGPLLAAVGYFTAAKLTVFPAAHSLALLALLGVLRIVVRDFHALITGTSAEEAGNALVPVLVIFVIALATLPLFALIWGARLTDLSELWTRFRDGFTFGDTKISPSVFLTFLVVFAFGFALTRLMQGALRTSVLPKTRLDTGGRNAIVAGLGYVGIFLAVILAITSAGIDLSSLAIVAGALSVGIGFGLQNVVSNFVAGIILLIERPISEGDWIEVGGQMGYVRDISVRSTRIETFDRTDVIVPNADFVSGMVTNWTRGNLVGRVIVPVSVAYGSDTRRVETILTEIAESHPLVVLNPPPSVLLVGFGADGMNFEIRAILRDVNFVMAVKSDMNHDIVTRFVAEGFEIPFAQRDIWLRNPETLREPATGARPPGAPAAWPPDPPEQQPLATRDTPSNDGGHDAPPVTGPGDGDTT